MSSKGKTAPQPGQPVAEENQSRPGGYETEQAERREPDWGESSREYPRGSLGRARERQGYGQLPGSRRPDYRSDRPAAEGDRGWSAQDWSESGHDRFGRLHREEQDYPNLYAIRHRNRYGERFEHRYSEVENAYQAGFAAGLRRATRVETGQQPQPNRPDSTRADRNRRIFPGASPMASRTNNPGEAAYRREGQTEAGEPYGEPYYDNAEYEERFEEEQIIPPMIGLGFPFYGLPQAPEYVDYLEYAALRRPGRAAYLRCRDIMTRNVKTCSKTMTIREVADLMDDEEVGSIPVVDDGKVIGIVTDRDIVCRVLAADLDTRSTPVEQALSTDIVTCTPEEPVVEAIYKMGEFRIRRIPIVDYQGRLQGILSLADIVLEAENDQELFHALHEITSPTPQQARKL